LLFEVKTSTENLISLTKIKKYKRNMAIIILKHTATKVCSGFEGQTLKYL